MNKIILKFSFLDELTLNIMLVYVDDIVLAKEGNIFISYYDTDQNFLIYSANNSKVAYTPNALKLPSFNEYKPCEVIELKFKSNNEMKTWLKKLYVTLHNWYKLPDWNKKNKGISFNTKVKLQNDFWIL